MSSITRIHGKCDHCGKLSDCIHEGTGGLLPMGWGHAKALRGWYSLTIAKTDAEIAAEGRSVFNFGHASADKTFHLCSQNCVKSLLKERGIPKTRISEISEMGLPPKPRNDEWGGAFDEHIHPDARQPKKEPNTTNYFSDLLNDILKR